MNRAIYEESAIREASFLGLTYDICDVPVRQLTPYKYILLDFINSPFIKKTEELDDASIAKHVFDFIWIVSADFKENDAEAKATFIKEKLADLDFVKAMEDIYQYINDMFLDAPPLRATVEQTKQYKPQHWAWIVSYIDNLSEAYGWTDEYILHLPMPRILQYNNAIYARKMSSGGKSPALVNPRSDPIYLKIKQEHMRLAKEKV